MTIDFNFCIIIILICPPPPHFILDTYKVITNIKIIYSQNVL